MTYDPKNDPKNLNRQPGTPTGQGQQGNFNKQYPNAGFNKNPNQKPFGGQTGGTTGGTTTGGTTGKK